MPGAIGGHLRLLRGRRREANDEATKAMIFVSLNLIGFGYVVVGEGAKDTKNSGMELTRVLAFLKF